MKSVTSVLGSCLTNNLNELLGRDEIDYSVRDFKVLDAKQNVNKFLYLSTSLSYLELSASQKN